MKITLDHEKLLYFTGWKPGYIQKKGKAEIISKLESMGMENVTVNGRGKDKTYSFNIPDSFWITLAIPNVKQSDLMVDIVDILTHGNIINGLVMFHIEFYDVLADKHITTAKAVENTFCRIKEYLKSIGMLNKSNNHKSHRVIKDENKGWLSGDEALSIDARIRGLWKEWHERHKGIDEELFRKFRSEFYFNKIPRLVGAVYYRTVKMVQLDQQFHKDVAAARQTFLVTFNLEQVRQDLFDKHEVYRQLVKHRKEEEAKKKQAASEKMLEDLFAS
ncbi:hypothetical protein ACIFOT_23960 [Neobacillus sp. NRS-1170]|uniref:hypothetical protein n=1 Tax=Neobacillus sp. NRS-1170 TaxID=3233898 RepID=UPI003D27C3CD